MMKKYKLMDLENDANKKSFTSHDEIKPISFRDELLGVFFEHQVKIKMFHFETTLYSGHKASDKYLKKFEKNFDKFMECLQGKTNKLNTNNININANMVKSIDDLVNYLKETVQYFTNDKFNVEIRDSALFNIRDEIVDDIYQFIYLLTFE